MWFETTSLSVLVPSSLLSLFIIPLSNRAQYTQSHDITGDCHLDKWNAEIGNHKVTAKFDYSRVQIMILLPSSERSLCSSSSQQQICSILFSLTSPPASVLTKSILSLFPAHPQNRNLFQNLYHPLILLHHLKNFLL